MNINRPKILIMFAENGENGGPFISHLRIINSELKKKYDFVPIYVPRIRELLNPLKFHRFIKKIQSEKPAIVHCAGLQINGFMSVVACKIANIKNIVIAIHGTNSESLDLSYLTKKAIVKMEEITLKFATVNYGVSEYVNSIVHIKRYSQKSYGVIYNLPHKETLEKNNNYSIRKELGIRDEDIIIISTGRITQEKGYCVLSDAILNLELRSNIRFLIVGDGDYLKSMKDKLKELVEDRRVFFLGYRDDVEKLLSESDIFVLCTLHETLSNSTLEAGKQGLPAVVTNVGGLPEIIIDGVNGILVPVNNYMRVTMALSELIEDETLRRTMGNNAKQIVNDKFSEHKITERLDVLYSDLICNKIF